MDINRSTFYLHYTDIYNMLEKVEDELFEEILHTIRTHPVSPFNKDSFPFIEDIFAILFDNREICADLLGPHGDIGFLHRIEEMLSQYSLTALREAFPERMDNLKYTYAYCVAGGVGLIKDWLSRGCEESPQHMAQLTFRLVTNTVSDFYPHS